MSTSPTAQNKNSYKVRNWKEYNKNLCKRGSLTLWIDNSVLKEWESLKGKKKVVGEVVYSTSIITCCLLMKINYKLRLRQSTGFLSSLFQLLGKEYLPVPDYSTLCRRQGCLPVDISNRLEHGENLVVGIDSTGLKVYGEGEWKVRKHGYSKHRTWRKLHICIDLSTQEILDVELTGNEEDDASVGTRMIKGRTDKIKVFKGDGAYDKFGFREALGSDIIQVIPPPKNAVIQQEKKNKPLPDYLHQRNETVEYINNHGDDLWKQQSGYHQRSLNEVAMFRYKTIFTGELDARKIENQKTEVKLKCAILNKFLGIGMPEAYIAA